MHNSPAAGTNLQQYLNPSENTLVSMNEFPYQTTALPTPRSSSLNFFLQLAYKQDNQNISRAAAGYFGYHSPLFFLEHLSNYFCSTCEVNIGQLNFLSISVYMSPSENIEIALNFLRMIFSINNLPKIICTDANARNSDWLNSNCKKRGEHFLDWVAENDLLIFNDNNLPTSKNGHGPIDYIICSPDISHLLTDFYCDQDTPSLRPLLCLMSPHCTIYNRHKIINKTF